MRRFAGWKCPRGYVENVAAAIVLAIEDERAAGRIYNVSEPLAFAEADWVRGIGEIVGWRGEVVTVPAGRIPVPYQLRSRSRHKLAADPGGVGIRRARRCCTKPSSGPSPGSGPIRPSSRPIVGLLDYEAGGRGPGEQGYTD